jgi:hypothetical protein
MTWTDDAACKGATAVFYTDGRRNEALAICRRCPVLEACRADTLAEDLTMTRERYIQGVRGGMLATERRAHYVNALHDELPEIEHGTVGGYAKHFRYGQRPCVECRRAQRDYQNEFRRARRAAEREMREAS